jgi:hypothetical protein
MKSLARWLAAWACLGILIGPTSQTVSADPPAAAAAAPKAAEGPEHLDLSYVPADAVAAIIAHPQTILTSPEAEMMPVEVITAMGLKEYGFDPVKIRRAILFMGAPTGAPPGPGPDRMFAVVLQFSEPYSKDRVLAQIGPSKEVVVDGKTFFQLDPTRVDVEPLFHFPDEKTIIIGMVPFMKQMLSGKESDSPLVSILRKTNLSSDLTAVLSVDMVREQLKQSIVHVPPLPSPLQGFLKAPDLLSAVLLSVNVSEKLKANLTLRARDETSGEEVEALVNQGLNMAKQMMLAQMSNAPRRASDPVREASMKYEKRVTDKVFGLIKPVRKGQNVTIAVETDSSVATIGVLVALLLPAIQAARAAANRNTNLNKLRQVALAMHNYEAGHRHFPAHAIYSKDGRPLLSWRVAILPQLEEVELYKQFHLDERWDSEHNKPLIDKMPAAYAKAGRENDNKTVFLVPVGKGLAFEGDKGLTVGDFTDGTSKTILAVEVNDDRAVPWTKPDDLEVDLNKPFDGLGEAEAGGITCLVLADGHTMGITNQIDIATLKALFTRNGGEPIDDTLIR